MHQVRAIEALHEDREQPGQPVVTSEVPPDRVRSALEALIA